MKGATENERSDHTTYAKIHLLKSISETITKTGGKNKR
jgi:hypothetical protein